MADDDIDAPEEWRPVPFPEYADKYHVSNHGRVRKILKTTVGFTGHVRLSLCRDDTVTSVYVHRVVAMAFISPPPSPYHEVAHRNGDPADNRLSNLRWVTSAENKEDNRVNGTMVVGERHYRAKLAAEQISEIRCLYAAGGITQEQLSEQFGVHRVQIGRIIRDVAWRHVGRIIEPPAPTQAESMDQQEEWRPVPFPGFADKYFVSNRGRCCRMLKPGLGGKAPAWVPHVGLASGGRSITKKVHRLVALAFLGPQPSPKHLVAHWDGNSMNNHVSNLRWATDRENKADARRHGTWAAGERHGQAVLTEAQVRGIHALWSAGEHTQKEIAERYGTTGGMVSSIICGKIWKHLGIVHARRPRKN